MGEAGKISSSFTKIDTVGKRPPHQSLHAVGVFKLAKGLVNRQAISYTLLEKREPCKDRASFQELV
jgi:hypothetical protein